MLGVSLSAEQVLPYLGDVLWISAVNSRSHCVVSTRDLVFTADSPKLAMGAGVRLLDLEKLNAELAESGLNW